MPYNEIAENTIQGIYGEVSRVYNAILEIEKRDPDIEFIGIDWIYLLVCKTTGEIDIQLFVSWLRILEKNGVINLLTVEGKDSAKTGIYIMVNKKNHLIQ